MKNIRTKFLCSLLMTGSIFISSCCEAQEKEIEYCYLQREHQIKPVHKIYYNLVAFRKGKFDYVLAYGLSSEEEVFRIGNAVGCKWR